MGNTTPRHTVVSIQGEAFHLNGRPTYEGRVWRSHRIEGLLREGYTNVIVEIDNECNVGYSHEVLQPHRVHELIAQVKAKEHDGR